MSGDQTGVMPSARGRIGESLGIVLSFAMILSGLYLGEVFWKAFVEGSFVGASRDVAWMAPISAAVSCTLILAPVILAARFLPSPRARRVSVFCAAALAAFAVLLPWGQIHRAAAVMLAVGVGTMAIRFLESDGALTRLRRTAIALAVAHMAAALAIFATLSLRERSAFAALPPAREGVPNVLLIILDTVRASALSLYGYSRETTPEIDRFASNGTVFEHGVATAPWTLPSHASIFTGHYPGVLSTQFRETLDGRFPTLAEAMRDAGYETTGFTANLSYTGWDSGLTRGFIRYTDFERSLDQVLRSGWIGKSSIVRRLVEARSFREILVALWNLELVVQPAHGGDEYNATQLVDRVLAWQEERDTTRPFFAFMNVFDPHDPYAPPGHLRNRFTSTPDKRDLYDAEIFYTDQELGRLFGELERSGVLRNTLVVITSDHGEHFGENRRFGHANSLYTQLVRVPLVMRLDGRIPAGRRVPDVVSLRDIAATILDVTQTPGEFPGVSLAGLWSSDSTRYAASEAISELSMERMPLSDDPLDRSLGISIITNSQHFIHRNGKRGDVAELYAFPSDIDDSSDLAKTDSGRVAAMRAKEQLRALLSAELPLQRLASTGQKGRTK